MLFLCVVVIRILCILWLLALVIPPVVNTGWMRYEQSKAKREAKHTIMKGLGKEELTLFTLETKQLATDLLWTKKDEFKYKGKMYDIVYTDTDTCAHHVLLWCWDDNNETRLVKVIDEMAKLIYGARSDHNNSTQQKLFDFYKSLYCNDPVIENFFFSAFDARLLHSDYYQFCLSEGIIKCLDIPPPSA